MNRYEDERLKVPRPERRRAQRYFNAAWDRAPMTEKQMLAMGIPAHVDIPGDHATYTA